MKKLALPVNNPRFTFLFFVFSFAMILQSCENKEKIIGVDPAFSQYIDAYTSGIISKTSSIKIQLSANTTITHAIGEVTDKDLFSLSPSVKGKAAWIDARTIEFKPVENLKPGQLYEVSFGLGKVTKVPSKYEAFKFNVQTVKPSFSVTESGLRSTGQKDKMFLPGIVETADIENDADVKKLLTANQNSKNLKIAWQHNGNAKTHNFTV
ncbi:MAG: hypothetical protein ABI091_28215, partial [Ferruginibacter sp.]